MTSVHTTAAIGFDADADRYARGRPDYPVDVEFWLRDAVQLAPGKTAIDLGAGTGKFTRRLLATGAKIIAVEPVVAMRAKLAADLPNLRTIDGTAEAIPLPDASFDAVVCAQAFHWFATAGALEEIRRVLKPGGALGLIWNTRDDSVPWVKAAFAVTEPYEGDVPRFHSGAWRSAFPARGFGDLSEVRFAHGHIGAPQTVIIDRLLSVSFIARLPAAERERVAARLHGLIAATPELAGKAEITLPYTTFAYTARKL